jgi:hypothetical protein
VSVTVSPEQQALSSAAKRVSSQYNLHSYVGNHGQWSAFRLSDGTSDGSTYPTRASAISHQSDLHRHLVIQILPNGLTPEDAERLLVLNRNTSDRGYREEVGQPSFILPVTQEDITHWIERSR